MISTKTWHHAWAHIFTFHIQSLRKSYLLYAQNVSISKYFSPCQLLPLGLFYRLLFAVISSLFFLLIHLQPNILFSIEQHTDFLKSVIFLFINQQWLRFPFIGKTKVFTLIHKFFHDPAIYFLSHHSLLTCFLFQLNPQIQSKHISAKRTLCSPFSLPRRFSLAYFMANPFISLIFLPKCHFHTEILHCLASYLTGIPSFQPAARDISFPALLFTLLVFIIFWYYF